MTTVEAIAAPKRADEISTKRAAGAAFMAQRSGRVLLSAFAVLALTRLLLGAVSWADGVVIAVTLALVGPFEWLVHRGLLHAPESSFRMQTLSTGRGHVEHHKDPAELQWLMLCWRDALIFTAGLGLLSATWAAPVAVALGAPVLSTIVMAWTTAAAGLLHYEWTHLLVHTRYRCRSRYYAALERHHRLHHYRNERYWLGVTARSGDRLFATMPERGAVDASPTARTLGQD